MDSVAAAAASRIDGAGNPDAIVMTHARRAFGSVIAVDDLTMRVPSGTTLGVIGPSGAGKTTAIRLITGGVAATSGTVRVLDEDPRRFKRKTRERIGYVPQQFILYPDLTARENVSFMASLFGMLWLRRRRRSREVLELVDLWEVRNRRASELSGGMQRRLELACALVHDPALLILDEPTAGLDPLLRKSVWEELHRLREAGRTIIVTTQYVAEAEECDQVALIANGRLVALGAPEYLRRLALGGEVLEIETTHAFDASNLLNLPDVVGVRQPGPRSIWVIADNAATATPAIVDAVAQAGGEVAGAREYRPSFDEVFAELVSRDAEVEASPGDDRSASSSSGTPSPKPSIPTQEPVDAAT